MTTQTRKTAAEKKAEAAAAKAEAAKVKNPDDSVDKTVETAMKLNDALTPDAEKPQPTEQGVDAQPIGGQIEAAAKAEADAAAKAKAPTFVEKLEEIAAEAKAEAAAEAKAEAEAEAKAKAEAEAAADAAALTPYQLRVKNNGARAVCHVTHALIAANKSTVITYPSIQDKDLAQGNFAQINSLKGYKRFEVEG